MKSTIARRLLVAAMLLAGLMAIAPASASFPGTNGRIVFQSNRAGGLAEIYSMRPDATDVKRLTWNDAADRLPRFSRDGQQIVFARTVSGVDQDIWIMNADGSGERQRRSAPPATTPRSSPATAATSSSSGLPIPSSARANSGSSEPMGAARHSSTPGPEMP